MTEQTRHTYIEGEEYRWGRWAPHDTSIPDHGYDVAGMLRRAADMIDQMRLAPRIEDRAELLLDVYKLLDNGHWLVPKVKAWCVVKHYGDPKWENEFPGPAVWSAHFTEADAEAYAEVIRAKYNAYGEQLDGGYRQNWFTVERTWARAHEFKTPPK